VVLSLVDSPVTQVSGSDLEGEPMEAHESSKGTLVRRMMWVVAVACLLAAAIATFVRDDPRGVGGMIAVAVVFGAIGMELLRRDRSAERP
jgi:hypothetical protein